MSSKGYATPLRFEVGANHLLQRLYLGMTVSAVIVFLLLPLPVLINVLGVCLLLFLVHRVWENRAELGGMPVQLVWDGEQRWWWRSEDGEDEIELLGDSYLVPGLVVLAFRIVGSRASRAVVLTPEAIGEEIFRRIQVRFQITPKECSPV